jgi:hypothetical protein
VRPKAFATGKMPPGPPAPGNAGGLIRSKGSASRADPFLGLPTPDFRLKKRLLPAQQPLYIFKLVEKGGKASCTAVFTTLYRQVRKKCANHIKFRCAPAIGLDFYQVYFFMCRWPGIRTDRCKEKDKGHPYCQPPVGHNGYTPCLHALYFTRFSIPLQQPRILNRTGFNRGVWGRTRPPYILIPVFHSVLLKGA